MTQENSDPIQMQGANCPLPHQQSDTVTISHGSGGKMTHDLILNLFHDKIGNQYLAEGNDAARILINDSGGQIAISTDAHNAMQMRDVIKYAVATARRGWLEPKDVVNTRGLGDIRALLKRR